MCHSRWTLKLDQVGGKRQHDTEIDGNSMWNTICGESRVGLRARRPENRCDCGVVRNIECNYILVKYLFSLALCSKLGYALYEGAMTTKKNYYICLRFHGRPKIHLTLRYMKNLTPHKLAKLLEKVEAIVVPHLVGGQFRTRFMFEAWYGSDHTVRCLEPRPTKEIEWPEWVKELTRLEDGDTTYSWSPHVKCQDEKFELPVIAVSVMCKKVEIARWDLS